MIKYNVSKGSRALRHSVRTRAVTFISRFLHPHGPSCFVIKSKFGVTKDKRGKESACNNWLLFWQSLQAA